MIQCQALVSVLKKFSVAMKGKDATERHLMNGKGEVGAQGFSLCLLFCVPQGSSVSQPKVSFVCDGCQVIITASIGTRLVRSKGRCAERYWMVPFHVSLFCSLTVANRLVVLRIEASVAS
jgi:hypothetical protein